MAKPAPSRTFNPLHFEDLSPQRFEDLTRSLIYDFRDWATIEAVGRVGADHGIDIRALEQVTFRRTQEDAVDEAEDAADSDFREWIFQCKRYRRLGPKQVAEIVESDLTRQPTPPYGYVLVATCDFSHAARAAFREKMVQHGVREFYIWGKGELEDRLYQPKNDHLLFAYFGISLQVSRRSQVAQLRSNLTLKRTLVKTLGDIQGDSYVPVLLRDPSNDKYPDISPVPENPINLPWNYWSFSHHAVRNGLFFVVGRAQAYVDWTTGEWDFIEDDLRKDGVFHDLGAFRHAQAPSGWLQQRSFYAYWSNRVPDTSKAHLVAFGRLPYDRILLVDELGDAENAGPHILINYLQGADLVEQTFGPELYWSLRSARNYDNRSIAPEDSKRVAYFPKEIPEEDTGRVVGPLETLQGED